MSRLALIQPGIINPKIANPLKNASTDAERFTCCLGRHGRDSALSAGRARRPASHQRSRAYRRRSDAINQMHLENLISLPIAVTVG